MAVMNIFYEYSTHFENIYEQSFLDRFYYIILFKDFSLIIFTQTLPKYRKL